MSAAEKDTKEPLSYMNSFFGNHLADSQKVCTFAGEKLLIRDDYVYVQHHP